MAGTLFLINMVPNSLSGESEQDSEPMLAVDPNNPLQIVGTAFTPNPMGGTVAPVYVSVDGGKSWTLNPIVPADGEVTGDITVTFGPRSSALYAGILKMPTGSGTTLRILRSKDATSATPMDVLTDRTGVDQPFAQSMPNGKKSEVLLIGDNDFDLRPGKTSNVDYSLDAAAATAVFKNAGVEWRSSASQNGPQVRAACHASGVVYVVYYGWRKQTGSFEGNTLIVTADVVVVRDDSGAAGPNPFMNLKDPKDSLPGRLVAQGVRFPFRSQGKTQEGQQRLGGDLSIAVDPNNSEVVYLAYSALSGTKYTLHVLESTDSGKSWSKDILTIPFGINVALSVNAKGDVGLLYQKLTGSGKRAHWETHFQMAAKGSTSTWSDLTLSNHPANSPLKQFDPYLGDYAYMTSQGHDFYGIFSASNEPDVSHFPNGVIFQRNHDFSSKSLTNLSNSSAVPISIDPFFFKYTP